MKLLTRFACLFKKPTHLKILWAVSLCLLAAAPASGQPVIRPSGVQNAASNVSASRPGQGLTPGSIFVVTGGRLGPPDLLQAAPPCPLRFPDVEGGTRITITPVASGAPIDAALLYAVRFTILGIEYATFTQSASYSQSTVVR